MAQVSIKAFPRSEFGKGAARRSRREGLVPAVIYGQGQEPVHVGLPVHELTLALRYPGLVMGVTGDVMDLQPFLAVGCNRVFTKPLDVDAFRSYVHDRTAF